MSSSACITCSALLACGIPTSPPPLEPADFVLAGIPLDADSAEIRLSFGEPDSVVASTDPYDAYSQLQAWFYDGFVVRYSGEAVPSSYLVTGGEEATARGIRVGDTAALLLKRYGEPTFRYDRVWTYTDVLDDAGAYVLEFLVEDDTVTRIHVGRAND